MILSVMILSKFFGCGFAAPGSSVVKNLPDFGKTR
jgi:hypothetical protein